ncbi:VPLPA-CTERM sorting domain-containing protein [uncultured Jannaschia sp.]|uniref:VPLPA-CTERM sorting domain-containing protein n=1 Tax=uncultured Jannaschia sp. TaxID=293347 RepID=UPI00262A0D2B|nr:VPLPA-CTERM sorting domain-containing protein [uncultured Jannaschia sp.]
MISSKHFAQSSVIAAMAVAGTFAIAGSASAAHLGFTNYPGNICTGNTTTPGVTTGNGLGDCAYNGSPVIARVEFGGDDIEDEDVDLANFSIESFYEGVTADDFSFMRVANLDDGMGGTTFGYSFTYTPDDDDPLITAFAAKGSNSFNLYDGYDGETYVYSATFLTPVNNGGNRAGLSNLTFFDTELTPENPDNPGNPDAPAPVPLPAAGFMLLAGLGGLGAMRRLRKH